MASRLKVEVFLGFIGNMFCCYPAERQPAARTYERI